MGDDSQEIRIGLHDKSGALLMINKKERRLVRNLLAITLKSPNTRRWIERKLGKEYLEIGEKLLKSMGS